MAVFKWRIPPHTGLRFFLTVDITGRLVPQVFVLLLHSSFHDVWKPYMHNVHIVLGDTFVTFQVALLLPSACLISCCIISMRMACSTLDVGGEGVCNSNKSATTSNANDVDMYARWTWCPTPRIHLHGMVIPDDCDFAIQTGFHYINGNKDCFLKHYITYQQHLE